MVVLSVAVCHRNGRVLVARQYVPMTRLRIEGLLAAFPKLIASEGRSSRQHTFVETDEVRYIYQPMDQLNLLLITNMQSNIIEDLNTMRMIAKLIPEYCMGHDEDAVMANQFELVFAFDEVVSPGGYREYVNFKQIRTYTEMDSAEEKLNDIIQESKIKTQEEVLKRKANEFAAQRREQMRLTKLAGGPGLSDAAQGFMGSGSGNSFGGFGSGSAPGFGSDSMGGRGGGGGGGGGGYGRSGNGSDDEDHGYKPPKKKKKKSGKRAEGFVLKKKAKDEIFDRAREEDENAGLPSFMNMMDAAAVAADTVDDGPSFPVELKIIEKMAVELERDGDLKRFDIKGEVELAVTNPDASKIVIATEYPKKSKQFKYQWRPHPRLDQGAFKQGIIQLADADKSYRIGRSQKTAVLKWRMSCKDDSLVPLQLNYWPEAERGKVTVSARYEIEQEDVEMHSVVVTIPIPNRDEPEISNVDGETTYNRGAGELQWLLGDVSTGDEGRLDFSIDECDPDDMYPVEIHFQMDKVYSGLHILEVRDRDSDEVIEFGVTEALMTDRYEIS